MATLLTALSPWRLLGAAEPRGRDRACWHRFLSAASAAAFYTAGPYPPLLEKMRGLPPNIAIAQAPRLPLDYYYSHFREFRNPNAGRPVAQPMNLPWQPRPKTLAVKPWFHVEAGVDVACEISLPAVEQSRAECLAAPVDVLEHLAGAALSGKVHLESLSFGVIAFTGVGRTLLTSAARDLLWRAFQVPVYEQFRGFHGELLAWECERHDGMHLDPATAVWETARDSKWELLLTSLAGLRYPAIRLETGLRGILRGGKCDCGLEAPRLCHLARRERAMAAAC